MSQHLSEEGVSMHVIGDASLEEREHARNCAECQQKIASLVTSLSHFRGAVQNWSDRAGAAGHAVPMRWTVIPPADHLERLLLPGTLDVPWYRSLWSNLREFLQPEAPPLDITAKPVLVRDIWGQYGRQKKSWVMSTALQTAAVVLVCTVASTKIVLDKRVAITTLVYPDVHRLNPTPQDTRGGGGGGDGSPLPASKGRLPKAALKQFTPPSVTVQNPNPRLSMEATIIAPPDANLPQVNMAQYGDPLAKLGPPSNGSGSGGGIGTGSNGGVGPGKGGGFGAGEGSGVGGGVFKVGGGVTAPSLVSKVEPEYSEEARKAKYQGTVALYIEVDSAGRAQNIRVVRSLGLGLDEKAIEAVKRWRFRPGYKDGKPVTVAATIEVNFRLL